LGFLRIALCFVVFLVFKILPGFIVVGQLRQRDQAPKLSESKQADSDSDSSPKAEPREQRGLSIYTI
jgi:hypothetical protein